ncbi:MAG: hypothetical protein ABIH38_03650 [Patescibacteria group bacterium]
MSGKMISIAGLDKAAVLAALYNSSKPQGMGFMHYDPTPMTPEDALCIIYFRGDDKTMMFSGDTPFVEPPGPDNLNFDYLNGRVMKVDLSGDEFDPWGYDRDNGDGEAERVINELRQGQVNSANSQASHHINTLEAAEKAKEGMETDESRFETGGDIDTLHLGLKDRADVLGPAVDDAVRKLRKK